MGDKRYAKNVRMAHQVLALAALSCMPSVGNAQTGSAISVPTREQMEQLHDRAVPPEMIADVIVDFLPHANMPLNVPFPTERPCVHQ